VNNYRKVKISEIAEVIGGGTPSTRIPEYWEGNISWLTPKDLTNYSKTEICNGERNITELGLSKSSARLLDEGAVLLTSRAPIGYVAIAGKALATNQGFKSLIVKPKLASNYYLYYWLKGNTEYLNSLGTGTTFAEISGSVIKDIEITLPPLKEQQAIAEVLSSIDDKIDLLHRNNKTLEEMAETLFRQWFVEGAKEDWGVKRLDDICSHIKKSVNPKKEGSTLFLHYSLPAYDNGKRPELTEASAILSNKYLIQQDDMLISKLNPRTPRVWMIGNTALNSICSTEFQVYRAKEDCYRAFSYCFLKTQQVTDTLAGAASGTSGSHQRVNPEDISALEFTLPPIELLQRFQSVVKPSFDKIQLNNQTILNLETTRNSLLPKLMSGQVIVKSSI
jgi:type I restriction enzyme S subunit